MKKYLFFYFLGIGINNLYAQTLLQDCKTQQPISNAIIYNASNNQILGTTDQQGKINLPATITDIVLVHPEYGSIPTINQAVICMDELLNNIIIEVKADAKEQLLAILKNTYAQYSADPFKDQYYYYKGTIYENDTLGSIMAQEESYYKNFTYYNTNYYYANQFANYMEIADPIATSPIAGEHLHYFFFSHKKQFRTLLKILKKLKVKKIDKDYYVYDDRWDNYWLFEINTTKNRVSKFVSTTLDANFFDVGDKILFKTKRKLIHRLIEVDYDKVGSKVQQQLQLFDVYTLADGKTKLAKSLKINTVNQQDIIIEKTYSFIQYVYMIATKRVEIEDLAKTIKEKK
ncbi:hypothetical protein [Myroides odoratus]|uniref:hypothetical protein n=1 Tax=Myroides odoratus TaxID=256 RepID=UPI000A596D6D|nr:hypothetical protein [Myroides odoratus]